MTITEYLASRFAGPTSRGYRNRLMTLFTIIGIRSIFRKRIVALHSSTDLSTFIDSLIHSTRIVAGT